MDNILSIINNRQYKSNNNLIKIGLYTNSEYSNHLNYCECGNKKTKKSKHCYKCYAKNRVGLGRKVERPPYNTLLKEVNNLGYVSVGKKYNVTDNTIRKWLKVYKKYN